MTNKNPNAGLGDNRELGSVFNSDIDGLLTLSSDNRELGSVFNGDINGLLLVASGKGSAPDEYRQMVRDMLGYGMTVLAQNVGLPDPVIYRSRIATGFDKHLVEVGVKTWQDVWDPHDGSTDAAVRENHQHQANAMRRLVEYGTDPFTITIEECRKCGVPIVASYRMNSEDWYANNYLLSDFERQHPEWRVRYAPYSEEWQAWKTHNDARGEPTDEFAGCLDPAVPEVYAHRMAIFREVAEDYDIDGIEFDWRRMHHMISDPRNNHPILTRMVRQTRQMLNEVARNRGRDRLLLGVRVCGSLDTPAAVARYGGSDPLNHADLSCTELGLDVRTWIAEELVDYVCPSLFWPCLPGVPWTKEFVDLAKGRNVGIYPTVFPMPTWAEDGERPVQDSLDARRRHKNEIVKAALQCYDDGADGISTYNWNRDDPDSPLRPRLRRHFSSPQYGRSCEGYSRVCMQVHPALPNSTTLRELLDADPPAPGL
ncbi:MAG: hypothetical protein CMJ49_00030 [Planctomycetaceae bacterium]|nr:hypothetical protein [Planctomycetaceae bacterium]